MISEPMQPTPFIAVVDEICDVEQTERLFWKRWAQQRIKLSEAHWASMKNMLCFWNSMKKEFSHAANL